MQERPAGWPIEGAVESVPEVFVKLPGSTWPPAMGDTPAGTGVCASWSVSRDLTGGFLPGQVRGVSGFSVAAADVQIPQPAQQLSPWSGQQLAPGGRAELYASHDGPDGATALGMGTFQVEPISGASTDPALALELIEDAGRLKRPVTTKWQFAPMANGMPDITPSVDASWVLHQIARAGGYYTTPKPGPSTVLSLPLCGGIVAEVGTTISHETDVHYRQVDHVAGMTGYSVLRTVTASPLASTFYLSLTVGGSGGGVGFGTASGNVYVIASRTYVQVNAQGSTQATIPLTPDGNLLTVQVRMTRASGGMNVSVRTSNSMPWTTAVFVPLGAVTPWSSDYVLLSAGQPDRSFMSGVRLDNAVADVWVEPTARIDLSYSPIYGVWDMDDTPAWDLAQKIATQTMGALWLSEDGIFTYRNRHTLRGVDGPVETIEALTQLETLAWRIDPADVADRVAVTYTPAVIDQANDSITLWEATNIICVRQNSTQVIYADIEGTTDRISHFLPVWNESEPEGRFSRWAASTSQYAGGQQPSDTALTFRTQMVGPSRVKITITNTTGNPLWLIDGNGDPTLTLRTSVHLRPGEPVTVDSGLPEEEAVAALSVDCGTAVQDHATAVEFCAWIEGQTRVAMPTIENVRVKPDLRRQIGDVVRITDGITSLNSKAIITGVSLAGDASGYTQTVKLALLATTFLDFDDWLTSEGVETFGEFDSWIANQNITTFAQLDGWLDTLGRTA